jgi:hypothetical protein
MKAKLRLGMVFVLAATLSGGAWSYGGEPGMEERPQLIDQTYPSAPQLAQEEPLPLVGDTYEPAPAPPPVGGPAECYQTCYRPVLKTREITCRRPVTKYRDETRTCKVPVPRAETRTREVTCWKVEMETVMTTQYSCQTTVDECGCCVNVPIVCEVPCQVPRRVPYTVEQQYQVCYYDWETKEYTVKVPYREWEEFTSQQQYCEWEPYQVPVQPCRVCCVNPCCCPR